VEWNCVEMNCEKEQLEEGLASIRRLVREKKDEVWGLEDFQTSEP